MGQDEKHPLDDKDAIASSSALSSPQSSASMTLKVGGMTCGSCVETIERMLRQQDGVFSITVALLAEKAVIDYDPVKWTPDSLAGEVEDMGFEATPLEEQSQDTVQLSVYGMTCASCTGTVEKEVGAMPGVISCVVSLATEKARIEFDRTQVGVRALVERIEDLGFDAVLADTSDSTQLQSLSRVREVAEWRRAFWFSLSFAVPVFLISMVFPKFDFLRPILRWQPLRNLYFEDILCLCLTIPVQFGIGMRFYRTTFKALRHGSATMDVLVVIGTTASFLYSTISMLVGLICTFVVAADTTCAKSATFFDTSTMLITFVSFGRYIENAAKGKTSEALSKLIGLTPSTATIYSDGEAMTVERVVPSELVQAGDRVKVIPGEQIAADGIVVRGESSVNESMVTGEAVAVAKKVGSPVIGGTVNELGSFDFVVTRAGKDTALAQIVRLVDEAQTSKAPIQAFADRAAGVFVPCVIGLGLITFIGWMVIAHLLSSTLLPAVFHQDGVTKLMVCMKLCISVIVVACPCALGLSTPTAVMVGTGVGAQNGILIKGGAPLEASYSIGTVMFDKTGTLTRGQLAVSAVCWADGAEERGTPRNLDAHSVAGLTRSQILYAIGAAEGRSEHPLARAVASFADLALGTSDGSHAVLEASNSRVSAFESVTGEGISCRVSIPSGQIQGVPAGQTTHQVLIGSLAFLSSDKGGVPALPTSVSQFQRTEEADAHTVVYASVDGALAVALALADEIKPEAKQAIDALKGMGIRCGMLTGDSETVALAVAKQVGIDAQDVHAGLSPNGKRSLIADMRSDAIPSPTTATSRRRLRPQAPGVAMVGDGINDSPALATADVGIALCSGADVAMEAASVVLMRADLLDVPASIHLARRIFRQIRLNFLWATAYNLVAVPLAMGIFLPWGYHLHPMVAGAAMACSSVSVILSSLTLRWWKRPEFMRSRQLVGSADFSSARSRPGSGWGAALMSTMEDAVRSARDARFLPAFMRTSSRPNADEGGYAPIALEAAA